MVSAVIPAAEAARIRDALLGGIAPLAQPVIHVMAGIPGAGKTFFVAQAQNHGHFPKIAFILNPDIVMEALHDYHADVKTLGVEGAFNKWELPCRALAYALGREAASLRLPIIKDMGMARSENWEMLQEFKAGGYRIELHVIRCPIDVAVQSCAVRPRHFPPDQISIRAQTLERLLDQYKTVPDAIFWYERTAKNIQAMKL